jgi:phospholipid transport system substrate-binding protein
MRLGFLSRCVLIVVLVFGLEGAALAADPMAQIKATTDKIIAIVTDPALKAPAKEEERRKLIRQAADERFDWEEMARRSLARYWAQRTGAERQEFVRLYSDLLERTYMDKIENYSGEKVYYTGENVAGDYAVVTVKVVTKKEVEIPVEYRMLEKGNNWLIYDVSIEGVSLVYNYRVQFNDIILRSSYAELVKRLKAKVDQNRGS